MNQDSLILILLIFGISVVALVVRSARFKGFVGENRVKSEVEALTKGGEEFRAFHDIVLRTPDGTTQVDHILVSPYGIFVIETKNLKGWIFGDMRSRMWTQSLYRKKFRFQNPLRQNYKHVRAVQDLLALDRTAIHSIVVFVGDSEFRTIVPNNVVTLRGLLPYIHSQKDRILDKETVDVASAKLNNPQGYSLGNGNSHVRNLKRNLENPACPRCGKQMVLRTARKGRNAGNKFWGCSDFPNCRATKDVA